MRILKTLAITLSLVFVGLVGYAFVQHSNSASTGLDVPVAEGIEIAGNGYKFYHPHDWREYDEYSQGQDVFVGTTDRHSEFLSIAVTVTDTELPEYGRLIALTKVYGDLERLSDTYLDGEQAMLVALFSSNGLPHIQLSTVKNNKTYSILFSFSKLPDSSERMEFIEPVIESWQWD